MEYIGTGSVAIPPKGALAAMEGGFAAVGIFFRKALGFRSKVDSTAFALFVLVLHVVLSVPSVARPVSQSAGLEALAVELEASGVIFSCMS